METIQTIVKRVMEEQSKNTQRPHRGATKDPYTEPKQGAEEEKGDKQKEQNS